MPSAMIPRVVDISHHNVGPLKGGQIDFSAMAAAGIQGVICKASEGAGYGDPCEIASNCDPLPRLKHLIDYS